MKIVKAVQFKIKKRKQPAKEPVERLGTASVQEQLTGFVNGLEASSYEERFARALSKNPRVDGFSFREHYFGPARTTPGSIEVDFIVSSGPTQFPIQIDGEYAHGNVSQIEQDKIKDARLDKYFANFGNVAKIQRVPDKTQFHMGIFETQEKTDDFVERLF